MDEKNQGKDWRNEGVRVIKHDTLDTNTAQTPGMNRAAAIDHARVGAQKIWAGTVTIHPNAKTGAHHHGALESVIYIVRGHARMRWGEQLEFVAEAGPGDFIYVPPYVPHQEINASTEESLECVLVRSDNEAVVVIWISRRWRRRRKWPGSILSMGTLRPAPRSRGAYAGQRPSCAALSWALLQK
jgi:uncharacterized RmlC-like cupin family protein